MPYTRIPFWICRGVTRRRLELVQFVHEHGIDILLLNEIHHFNGRSFEILNFHSYYNNTQCVWISLCWNSNSRQQTSHPPPSSSSPFIIKIHFRPHRPEKRRNEATTKALTPFFWLLILTLFSPQILIPLLWTILTRNTSLGTATSSTSPAVPSNAT